VPSLSRAELRALGRRPPQPVKQPGEWLAVFVSGRLVNLKNRRMHYYAQARYKREWRDRVAMALVATGWRLPGRPHRQPLIVTLRASVGRLMDSQDGLPMALSPVVDALGECGVLTGLRERPGVGDEPGRGHLFAYEQILAPAAPGVELRVRPAAAPITL